MPCSKESALELLLGAHRAGRLGHAQMIVGATGAGKSWVAQRLAAGVLDCPPEQLPAHPDAHFVQPESKSRRILAEQIRRLESSIHRKPLVSRAKAAILTDADRLQPAAANAFLKTLEEPPERSFIILTTSLPEAVLETIRSRCMEIVLQGTAPAFTPEADDLIRQLAACLLDKNAIASAFRLTRKVQQALAANRERIGDEYQSLLKEEAAKFKNIAGSSDWLEEREEQMKAMAEAASLRERDLLLTGVFQALGGALRAGCGAAPPHPACAELAAAFSPEQIFAKLEAFERMRRRLALNVNEQLALECGFLEIAKAGGGADAR